MLRPWWPILPTSSSSSSSVALSASSMPSPLRFSYLALLVLIPGLLFLIHCLWGFQHISHPACEDDVLPWLLLAGDFLSFFMFSPNIQLSKFCDGASAFCAFSSFLGYADLFFWAPVLLGQFSPEYSSTGFLSFPTMLNLGFVSSDRSSYSESVLW